jgi:phosphate transport system protein
MTQPRSLDLNINALQQSLVEMGEEVEKLLALAIGNISTPVAESRYQAAEIERRIDGMEIAIEDRCHHLIALQTPMTRDLRFLISSTRVAAELARIAELSQAVVKRSDFIARHKLISNPPQLGMLGELAQRMTHQALKALGDDDTDGVKGLGEQEVLADSLTQECYRFIQFMMESCRNEINAYSQLLRAVGHLEHITDIAGSIAAETLFIQHGLFIRRKTGNLQGENR